MATLAHRREGARAGRATSRAEGETSCGGVLVERASRPSNLDEQPAGGDPYDGPWSCSRHLARPPALCMPPRSEDDEPCREGAVTMEHPLAGRHVIVPASRVDRNALADLLSRHGARVTAFPAVRAVSPSSFEALDAAIADVDRLDWIVLSGEHSVLSFYERLGHHGHGSLNQLRCSICAIGAGAGVALRERGRKPDAAPREHTPNGIAQALGPLSGRRLLLVREQTAAADLPDCLRSLGSDVSTASGYRAEIVATRAQVSRAFHYRPDMLALPSPTAARYFVRAATDMEVDVKRCLGGVTVAAVGLATAAEAERHGLTPDLVSCGHISSLARDLVCLYGSRR